MSVYVDVLMKHGWIMYGRPVKSCHMFADTEKELFDMALKIGMKLIWFQNKKKLPHFDLVESRRIKAVKFGAIEITSRQLVEYMRTGGIKFPDKSE